MTKRTTGARRRKSLQRIPQPEPKRGAPSGPVRIPGVHVAHIGGRTASIDPIRAYWQARGAIFMHHSLEPGENQRHLEEVLHRSHIVFYARAGASPELGRTLERYCERTEKPLILLEENSTWALATDLPLT